MESVPAKGGVVSSPLVEPHHAGLAYHPCLVNLNLTLANSSSRMSTEEGHHELGISDPILLNDVRGEGEEECKESTMAESQERNEDLTEPKADDPFRPFPSLSRRVFNGYHARIIIIALPSTRLSDTTDPTNAIDSS